MQSTSIARARWIAPELIVLGLVSFLTDVSSEMIFAVLPIYFVAVIGGSAAALGIMEGLADLASSSLDLASGYLADRSGKRKLLACSGYAISTAAKALLLVVGTMAGVIMFRVVERLGKSVRGAPRDALLAAIAPAKNRGLWFGVHKALDKSGAVVGPGIAYLLLAYYGPSTSTFQNLFWMALVPAIIAVVALSLFVGERSREVHPPRNIRTTINALGPRFWWYLAATSIFSLGYFSFAFLLLKARVIGFEASQQALLYGSINLVFALVSIPVGWLGDRIGRRTLVILSYLLYTAISLGLALASTPEVLIGMFALYGVFYAIDEGQAKAYIADLAADQHRATAMGIYGFVTGLCYLPASLIAGCLWSYGPHWTFAFAGATSVVALLLFLLKCKGSMVLAT